MADKIIVDYDMSGASRSGVLAVSVTTPASVSAAVPANTELLGITVTTPIHFRVGVGTQTAVEADPMASPGFPAMFIKLNPQLSYNIAAIAEPATSLPTGAQTAGTLSFYRVYEG